ncbi:MAG: hypothetical protein N3A59_01590 [Thermodesulfovibrionales bacterium]|nr:hypothetical protein [Thermodesulfovibrionales bacterium]
MLNTMLFRCPFLRGSNEGARCDAYLSRSKDNLIKEMEDVNIKLCINNKRRFEVCHIYYEFLRKIANEKRFIDIDTYKNKIDQPLMICKI